VAYGIPAGASVAWSDSLCQHMVVGNGPRVAIDVMATPVYAELAAASDSEIGAYIGVPLVTSDGELFGTICGFSPTRQEPSLEEQEPLLELLARLLSNVLEADQERTANARMLEQSELRAATDPLTGLLNRGGWEQLLEQEGKRYERFGDSCSLICIDLDDLKLINDAKGHPAGDEYLRRAAKTLAENIRDSDVVARVGGDEFGVLAPNATAADAEILTERLCAALSEAGVQASFGYAQYVMTEGLDSAWEHADAAMYEHKRSRRCA